MSSHFSLKGKCAERLSNNEFYEMEFYIPHFETIKSFLSWEDIFPWGIKDCALSSEMEHTECIHHLLHIRLATLARFNPTSIEFKHYFYEGMFKTPNQKGFHEVVNFLLNLVDSKKFKEKCWWPLLDRKMEQEFRKGVQQFIAEINKEDVGACIPAVTASMLHSPSGDKIVKFLIQLSQYVMQKQLRTKFSISEVIHQPQSFNNPMTSRILLKIIIAKIQNEKENIYRRDEEHDKYMSEAFNKSRTLEETLQTLDMQIKKNEQELKTLIDSPTVPVNLKMRIQSGDNSALEEWSKSLNNNMDHFEAKVQDLERISLKITDFHRVVENAVEWKKSPPCLDRDRLKVNIPTSISKTLPVPVFNAKGDLSLEGFFHYVKYLSEELKKQIVNRYPKTKNSVESKLVLEELMKHSLKLQEFENSLNNKLSETKASILSLQSKLYPHYEEFDQIRLSDAVFESQNINFHQSLNATNIYLERGDSIQLVRKIRKKLHEKRKLSVLCSIKHKACNISTKTVSKIPSLIKMHPTSKLVTIPAKKGLGSAKEVETAREKQSLKTPPATSISAKPKKLVYPRSTKSLVQKSLLGKNERVSKKKLESPKEQFTTPIKKQHKKRVPVSPQLESIKDYNNDISFGDLEHEVTGSLLQRCSLSSPQRSSFSWINDISFADIKQEVTGPLPQRCILSSPKRSSLSWRSNVELMETLGNNSMLEELESDSLLDMSKSTVSSDSFYNGHSITEEVNPCSVEKNIDEPPSRRRSLQALIDRYKAYKKRHEFL